MAPLASPTGRAAEKMEGQHPQELEAHEYIRGQVVLQSKHI